MDRRINLCLAMMSALCAAASAALAAERVRVEGTRVTLQPPAGFTAAKRFPGLECAGKQASVMVTEMPVPAHEVVKGMTTERLAAAGMSLLASRAVQVDGRDAVLLHVGQSAGGVAYRKWMLIAGDEKRSVLVVGAYPEAAADDLPASVELAVLSTSWSAPPLADPLEGLPFSVRPTAKLKVAGRVGNALLLTASGRIPQRSPVEALCAVAMSVSPVRIADLRRHSERRLRQTAQVKGIRILSGTRGKLGGLAAYEVVASAADAKTGAALRVYQVIAPHKGGYFMLQAMVGAGQVTEMLPEFRAVAASFRARAALAAP